jgi:hypothetical protein
VQDDVEHDATAYLIPRARARIGVKDGVAEMDPVGLVSF